MRKVPRIVSTLGAAAAACGLIVPVLMSASPAGATPSAGLPNGLLSTPVNMTSNNGLRYGEPEIAVNPQDPNNIVYYVMSQQLTFACEAAKDPNCVNDPLTGARDVVLARVDHAAGAAAARLPLPPTAVLLFGDPQVGTPLMQSNQTAGIDLPLKALVYQDAAGQVWLAYNNPGWVAQRHGLGAGVAANVQGLSKALEALAAGAVKSA